MKAHAVYAGSFDPITRGHLSVIRRAKEIFTRLVVVVAKSPSKACLLSPVERVALIREALTESSIDGWIEVTHTEGYVVHLAAELGAGYLVRGVRTATDIEHELTLARLNHELAPDITSWFVPAQPHLAEVSSSRLKALAARGEDITPFCTPGVARHLRHKLSERTRSLSAAGANAAGTNAMRTDLVQEAPAQTLTLDKGASHDL